MSIALKPGFRSLATLKLVVNVGEPQRTAAASRGFLAIARLSCLQSRAMYLLLSCVKAAESALVSLVHLAYCAFY